MKLTEEQKDTKIIFLTEENNRLRNALIDAQILLGEISVEEK